MFSSVSLEPDLNDGRLVILLILVLLKFIIQLLLKSEQRLDEVSVLFPHSLAGRPPPLVDLVAGDLLVDISAVLHDVVPHDVSSGSGLHLLQADDEDDAEDEDGSDAAHDDDVVTEVFRRMVG